MRPKGVLLVVAVFLSVALVLPGCQVAQKPSALKFAWSETDPKLMKFINDTVAEYQQKTGVEIQIESMPETDLWPKIQASISAGRPYDLATASYIMYIATLAEKNQLEPVDDIIAKFGDFLPYNLLEIHGKNWWVPYDYNVSLLFVRSDLLKEKGLNPPKSWDEMLTVAKALTDKEKDRYGIVLCIGENGCNDFLWSPIMFCDGFDAFDKDWNVILDSPEMKQKAVEALNFWKELYKYMPPGQEAAGYSEMLSLFATGRVAIAPYAGRMIHYMQDKSPDLLDKFLVIGYPSKDGKRAKASGYGDGFIVPKGPNSKAAKEFLAWFTEHKMAEFNATLAVHLLPTRKAVLDDPKYRDHPDTKRFWDSAIKPQYDLLAERGPRACAMEGSGPYFDWRPGTVVNAGVIKDLAQSVVLKNVPPDQAVDEAAKKIRDLIKQ
ncbi:MAG: sugar ABC transporter substrate-binding protein [Bacteroidetes bacterium]|nr:sugar ABC transporter substrate-binding protein [Bacteroidota bacterium]MCL5026358.1 sugar ABC transporter substrate-binding protein [Chloroflexota bacterium]